MSSGKRTDFLQYSIWRAVFLESAFRLDFLVEQQVVVEIKSVEAISNIHVSLRPSAYFAALRWIFNPLTCPKSRGERERDLPLAGRQSSKKMAEPRSARIPKVNIVYFFTSSPLAHTALPWESVLRTDSGGPRFPILILSCQPAHNAGGSCRLAYASRIFVKFPRVSRDCIFLLDDETAYSWKPSKNLEIIDNSKI